MEKKRIWILLLVLVASQTTGLRINEVMYNPEGSDNTKEWVEIKGVDNLSGYVIGDGESNSTLTLQKHTSGNFSLIVEDGFNQSLNASIYTAGSTVGNGLANGGDEIYLFRNQTLIDNMSYEGAYADDNGHSLELFKQSWNESLIENGTPGRANSRAITEKDEEDDILNSSNSTEGVNATTLAEPTNISPTNSCNVSLELNLKKDKSIYDAGETVYYENSLNKNIEDFKIEYKILDLYGNEVRKARNTSNTDEKQFTPRTDWPQEAFKLKNKLHTECNNTNAKVEDEEIVIVKGKKQDGEEGELCREFIEEAEEWKEKYQVEKIYSNRAQECPVEEPAGEIASFYTRKRKYDPEIKLFTRIEGEGLYRLQLESSGENISRILFLNDSQKVEFNVSAERGKNLYALHLSRQEERLATETLAVRFPGQENTTTQVESKPRSEERPLNVTGTKVSGETPTGAVVYDSSGNLGGYIVAASLILTALILGAIVWQYRRQEANFINQAEVRSEHGRRGNRAEDR